MSYLLKTLVIIYCCFNWILPSYSQVRQCKNFYVLVIQLDSNAFNSQIEVAKEIINSFELEPDGKIFKNRVKFGIVAGAGDKWTSYFNVRSDGAASRPRVIRRLNELKKQRKPKLVQFKGLLPKVLTGLPLRSRGVIIQANLNVIVLGKTPSQNQPEKILTWVKRRLGNRHGIRDDTFTIICGWFKTGNDVSLCEHQFDNSLGIEDLKSSILSSSLFC